MKSIKVHDFGSENSFKQKFVKPIEASLDDDCNLYEYQKRQGEECRNKLQEMINPFILQRRKDEVLGDRLPKKTVYAMWIHLSEEQRQAYVNECGTDRDEDSDNDSDDDCENCHRDDCKVDSKDGRREDEREDDRKDIEAAAEAAGLKVNNKNFRAIQMIVRLMWICVHPILMKPYRGERLKEKIMRHPKIDEFIEESPKLSVLVRFVDKMKNEGHRPLFFSKFTTTLTVAEEVLRIKGFNIARIDGNTNESQRHNFNGGVGDALLLTTGAGGVGLNLVGANRVIILDPAWTPAADNQAIDRVHRIGQTQEVEVFFLIGAGAIGEF